MHEIVAITECIDDFWDVDIRYTTCPFHSDIPFDEQMEAFNEPDKDEVKIIIATNAAESSITLPTVDHVICLGLCRQIIYNPTRHRQMLAPMWISQASAKQRAGRTGRVRPGSVYRLYTREAFESCMDEFDPGEISRVPLDSVILMLKEMLHEEVIPVLGNCIEPPSMDTIDRSFESLYRSNFIEEPNDQGDITSLGGFVSSLGIDLTLGSLIGLGIQFGVAAEAIEMAAMMSFPKTPFQITSPLFHNPAMFNKITADTYVARCRLDANLYSEPMCLMNALWEFDQSQKKGQWCFTNRIALSRMRQLASTRNSLRARVSRFFGIAESVLVPESPPVLMPHAKVNILRILQVWVFSDTMVQTWPAKNGQNRNEDGSTTINVKKGVVDERHLGQVLVPERHPYDLIDVVDLKQFGTFDHLGKFVLDEFVVNFQSRLVSYMAEMDIDVVSCKSGRNTYFFVKKEYKDRLEFDEALRSLSICVEETELMVCRQSKSTLRDVDERRCGAWSVVEGDGNDSTQIEENKKAFKRLHCSDASKNDRKKILAHIYDPTFSVGNGSSLQWDFPPTAKKKKKKKSNKSGMTEQKFSVAIHGSSMSISTISLVDLRDLLGSSQVDVLAKENGIMGIRFSQKDVAQPKCSIQENLSATPVGESSQPSWTRPLLENIPESARLLGVLASGYSAGKDGRLRFAKAEGSTGPEDTDDIHIDPWISNLRYRWSRFQPNGAVVVETNTVPSSAFYASGPLYACCSDTLEIKGGAIRVENMTLLPPNPLFVLLSLLSFGLQLNSGDGSICKKKQLASIDVPVDDTKQNSALLWFQNQKSIHDEWGLENPHLDWDLKDVDQRIRTAIELYESIEDTRESFVCRPERILSLCELFSFVDGFEMTAWDSLDETAFTPENLSRWQESKKHSSNITSTRVRSESQMRTQSRSFSKLQNVPVASKPGADFMHEEGVVTPNSITQPGQEVDETSTTRKKSEMNMKTNKKAKSKNKTKAMIQVQRQLDQSVVEASQKWFSSESDEMLPHGNYSSTGVLFYVHGVHSNDGSMSLDSDRWTIHTHQDTNGTLLFQVMYKTCR